MLFSFLLSSLFFFQLAVCEDMVTVHSETPLKKALIFGVSGQDGTYLTELLLAKGYEVHGVSRKIAAESDTVIGSNGRLILHVGDVSQLVKVMKLIRSIEPDEIYNLAAQSQVKASFDAPLETAEVNALGTLHILEAIRLAGLERKARFFQAATSELYGKAKESPQSESTDFYPRSPYGIAKLYSYWITKNYREAYKIFACSGILFNHESPLRPETFITRKITKAACRYRLGEQDVLYLGNLDSKRDWGYAKDYVEAMWLMLQQEMPEDYVIATGMVHSVREFVEMAYLQLGVEIQWQGKGVDEYGIDQATGNVIVKVDPQFFRPTEVDFTIGDSGKIKRCLNWTPATSFQDLLKIMIDADYERENALIEETKRG